MNMETMEQRVMDAIRRYEEDQAKARKRLAWSRIRLNGVRLPMRKPKMDRVLRVWCADEQREAGDVTNEIEASL